MAASKVVDGPVIGIDLGTTYSCVAVWRHDRSEVIANDQGNRLTPSCVVFTDDESLVGDAAVNQAAFNPTNTIFGENYTRTPVDCYIFFGPQEPSYKIYVVSLTCSHHSHRSIICLRRSPRFS
jgi:hypothetical protein